VTTAGRLTSLSRSVAGARVLVTGAASGMGRAPAHLFADEGARVAVVDLDTDRVEAVVDEIVLVHGKNAAAGFTCDVGDPTAVARLVDSMVDHLGGLDVLINNAGVALPTAVADTADDEFRRHWARTIDVNVTAHVELVRRALVHLQASGRGRIVNIASTEAIVATPGLSAYPTSKAAVLGLTKSLAVELGPLGVTVNCICPGTITTAMTAAIPDEAKARYARARVPLRRYGDPEEVAHMTLSLCLPASSYVTGAVVTSTAG